MTALGPCQFIGCHAPAPPREAVHQWRLNARVVAGIMLTENAAAPQRATFGLCAEHSPMAERVFGAGNITEIA